MWICKKLISSSSQAFSSVRPWIVISLCAIGRPEILIIVLWHVTNLSAYRRRKSTAVCNALLSQKNCSQDIYSEILEPAAVNCPSGARYKMLHDLIVRSSCAKLLVRIQHWLWNSGSFLTLYTFCSLRAISTTMSWQDLADALWKLWAVRVGCAEFMLWQFRWLMQCHSMAGDKYTSDKNEWSGQRCFYGQFASRWTG